MSKPLGGARKLCMPSTSSFLQTCLVRAILCGICVLQCGFLCQVTSRPCAAEHAFFAGVTRKCRMLCACVAAKLVSRLRRRKEIFMSQCGYFSQTCLVRGHFMRRLRVSESEGNRSRAHSGGIWSACTRGCEKALFVCSTSEFRMLWHCAAAK